MIGVSAPQFRHNIWSDNSSVLYAQGSHILESRTMDVVVRHVVLVEQLGQLVECLLMLVGDHSAKLEGQLRGTEQYDLLSVWQAQFGKLSVTSSSL